MGLRADWSAVRRLADGMVAKVVVRRAHRRAEIEEPTRRAESSDAVTLTARKLEDGDVVVVRQRHPVHLLDHRVHDVLERFAPDGREGSHVPRHVRRVNAPHENRARAVDGIRQDAARQPFDGGIERHGVSGVRLDHERHVVGRIVRRPRLHDELARRDVVAPCPVGPPGERVGAVRLHEAEHVALGLRLRLVPARQVFAADRDAVRQKVERHDGGGARQGVVDRHDARVGILRPGDV